MSDSMLSSQIYGPMPTFTKIPPTVPGLPPGLRWRLGQIDTYANPKPATRNHALQVGVGGSWATVSIGPGSSLSDVDVKPSNGPWMRCSVGSPIPVGQWSGPFQVRVNPEDDRGSSAIAGDIPVGATDFQLPAASTPVIVVPTALELDLWPQASQDIPATRSAERAMFYGVTGIDSLATLRLVACMPFYGRRFGSITCRSKAATLTFQVTGVHLHTSQQSPWENGVGPASLWAVSLGTFSVVGAAGSAFGTTKFVFDREHDGDWDRILLTTNGAQPAGPSSASFIFAAWDERD